MKRSYPRTAFFGFLIGLAVSGLIILTIWVLVTRHRYSRKYFYYEGYLFREKCRAEGKDDLQAATERYRIIHSEPHFKAEDHWDVKNGQPEAFIRGTLGHNLYKGFGYGAKPGFIQTLLEPRTVEHTWFYIWMTMLPIIGIVLAPFAGALFGCAWAWKKRGARSA
jgi:hypothetical protein